MWPAPLLLRRAGFWAMVPPLLAVPTLAWGASTARAVIGEAAFARPAVSCANGTGLRAGCSPFAAPADVSPPIDEVKEQCLLQLAMFMEFGDAYPEAAPQQHARGKGDSLSQSEAALVRSTAGSSLLHSLGARVKAVLQGRLRSSMRGFPLQDEDVYDVFPSQTVSEPKNGDEGFKFFMSSSWQQWIILLVVTVVSFGVDMLLLQGLPDKFVVHLAVLCLWILVAVGFNVEILMLRGRDQGLNWFTGYLLEWMLSMDNLFVFHLIFDTFKTPAEQIHRAVFLGILGAVIVRLIFFMIMTTLLKISHWIHIPFGILLIWSGISAARAGDDDDVSDLRLVRWLRYLLGSRLKGDYVEGCRMFAWDKEDGTLQFTLLFVVVLVLEVSDVIFAVDSVTAKIAQIPNSFGAFSSSVVAMFGIRSMFFIVKDLVQMFSLLQYGLCLILMFIGVELLMAESVVLAPWVACVVIISTFVVCIAGSVVHSRVAMYMGWAPLDNSEDCPEAVPRST